MMKNLAPNELIFSVDRNYKIDIAAYSSMDDFLSDVWNHVFHKLDSVLLTDVAADIATKAQDRAEIFWRKQGERDE